MPRVEHEPIKLIKGSLCFTWDDEKAKINIQKHGVSFYAAAGVFFDDNAFIGSNSYDSVTGEERFDITGKVEAETMFVVFVERITVSRREVIRIISARRANRKEMEQYVDGAE